MFLTSVAVAVSAPARPQHVVVIHSYHHGFPWTDAVQEGIERVLDGSDVPMELSVEYMDAKRYAGDEIAALFARLLAAKYGPRPPDVIISCDDDSLSFLFEYRNVLFPGVPVVFCGLNVEDFDPGLLSGRSGYTGVVERLDLTSTLDLILRLQPRVRRIAFVHDRTTSGLQDRATVEAMAAEYAGRVEFVFPDEGRGLTEDELLAWLETLPPDSAVYFLGFFRDRLDESFPSAHIIPEICEASPVPVYAAAEAYMGSGILGGKLLSGSVHGASTASKALRILRGTDVERVPVSVESSNRYVFDYRQLKRFGIPESALPRGSTIINTPASFLRRHSTAIAWGITGLLALISVTVFLAVNTLRRQRAERELRESEARYRLLAENVSDVLYVTDDRFRITYVSPSIAALTGYTPAEFMALRMEDYLHPASLKAIEQAIERRQESEQRGDMDDRVGFWEHRYLRKDGSVVWVETTTKPVRDEEGSFAGMIGVSRNISERKRLEQAQADVERILRHNVRSPVVSLISGLRLLSDIDRPEDRDPLVQDLQRTAREMLQWLDFFRGLAQLERGEYTLDPERVDLVSLLEEVRREVAAASAQHGRISLLVDGRAYRGDDGLMVSGESMLMSVLFRSLVQNAAESPTGGLVTINVRRGGNPYVTIHNEAPIPEPVRSRFFEKYSTAGKTHGTGLGTYSAKLVADAHAWDIRFCSSEEKGTTVRVTLGPANGRREARSA
jgi:PAS domain S-box-containing protein